MAVKGFMLCSNKHAQLLEWIRGGEEGAIEKKKQISPSESPITNAVPLPSERLSAGDDYLTSVRLHITGLSLRPVPIADPILCKEYSACVLGRQH